MKKLYITSILFLFFIFACNNKKSEQDKAIQKALQEGKTVTYKSNGEVEIDKTENEVFKNVKKMKIETDLFILNKNELTLLSSKQIDQYLAANIKKITQKDYQDIQVVNETGTEISNKLKFKLIQAKNISEQNKTEIEALLKKRGFKAKSEMKWTSNEINIYFIKKKNNYNLIISKL